MIQVLEKIDDKIDLISMKNDNIEVVVSNFGCTIVKVLMKDKDGNIDDVVLGYDDVNAYMNKYLNSQETQVNTVDVKSLKLVNNGISIISKWSKNENYVIPYTTNDGDVGAINLKVVRDKEYGGKVTIDINSDKTGHINAYCMCNDTRIQAYITSDSRTTSDNLLESESRLEDNMHELGYKECDIKISFAKKIPTISHAEKSSEKTPTNKLYKVAKTMINTIIETL